jgi:hypothetical protein
VRARGGLHSFLFGSAHEHIERIFVAFRRNARFGGRGAGMCGGGGSGSGGGARLRGIGRGG